MNIEICRKNCGSIAFDLSYSHFGFAKKDWRIIICDDKFVCCMMSISTKENMDVLNSLDKKKKYCRCEKSDSFVELLSKIDIFNAECHCYPLSIVGRCPYAMEHTIFDWNKKNEFRYMQ